MNPFLLLYLIVVFITLQQRALSANMIVLQNGTGTFSQVIGGGPFSPSQAVDGNFGDPNGWAIATGFDFGSTSSETAVWETLTNIPAGDLNLTMHFLHLVTAESLLGRFRFSVTTDDRNTFADGLHTGGDVTANWTVLSNPLVSGPSGMTFTTLADDSVLAGGTIAAQATYTVSYSTGINNITGLRLEALEDPALPGGNGPGLASGNGNFALTEMTLDATAVPEPSHLGFLEIALIGIMVYGGRWRHTR